MKKTNILKWSCLGFAIIVITACGSGGGEENLTLEDPDGIDPLDTTTFLLPSKYVVSTTSSFNSSEELIRKFTATYDTDGNILSTSFDLDGDGIFDSVATAINDPEGNILISKLDMGNDGTIDSVSTYTYDAQGNRLTMYHDTENDGIFEKRTTYTYDSQNNLINNSFTEDNADGSSYFSSSTYVYDDQNNQLSEHYYSSFARDHIYTYTYDLQGTLLTASFDVDGDDHIDRVTTYEYDDEGNKIAARTTNDIGITKSVYNYVYDEYKNLLIEYYYDDIGFDHIYTYTYDTQGHKLTEHIDNNGDSYADEIYIHTYDTNGNLILTQNDLNADGELDGPYDSYTEQTWLAIF